MILQQSLTTPLAAERLSDRLAALLTARIDSGELRPNDRLPTEAQLAEAHGVSRTVVREAVSRLTSQGLLRSRQGSGMYVAATAHSKPLAFDAGVLASLKSVVQVVEVRRALEGEVAALAAERATRADVAAIRRSLRAIDEAVKAGRDGVDEDLRFHRTIAEATGNPQFNLLLGFLEQYLRDAMRVTRGNEALSASFMHAVREEHRAIADAIAEHDAPAARAAATRHMQHAAQRLGDPNAPIRRVVAAPVSKTPS